MLAKLIWDGGTTNTTQDWHKTYMLHQVIIVKQQQNISVELVSEISIQKGHSLLYIRFSRLSEEKDGLWNIHLSYCGHDINVICDQLQLLQQNFTNAQNVTFFYCFDILWSSILNYILKSVVKLWSVSSFTHKLTVWVVIVGSCWDVRL